MAWKESDSVSERLDFVKLVSAEGANIAAICRRFGVSRKTGYKWLKRWRENDQKPLCDRSRRPSRSPGKTHERVEEAVLAVRREHPAWGGRKIRQVLLKRHFPSPPAASTISEILRRHGCISEEESAKHKPFTRFERSSPNELWQVDFKGYFAMTTGKACHPLTILDDHSRYSLGIFACDNQRRDTVQDHFRTVFQRNGMPQAIYVDNGNPWGTQCRDARHTRFSVWLMRHDIEVIHGKPYHPQGRGKLERFHRTLKLEVLQGRHFDSLADAQNAFDPWRMVYNHERPHEAIGLEVPASAYRASARCFHEVTTHYEYSSHFKTRITEQKKGTISFHSKSYYISEAFCGEKLGLSPTATDGVWDVSYCRHVIGQIDERECKFRHVRFTE